VLPAATGWQDPAVPERLQAWQAPHAPAEQQTPSTQLPLAHSPPVPQICPRRLSPHEPALQNCPVAQSASLAQTATHAVCVVVLQVNGKQDWVVAGLHVPAPSQVRTSVPTVEPAGQEGAAHWVPAL
jgi:hypothetical protein